MTNAIGIVTQWLIITLKKHVMKDATLAHGKLSKNSIIVFKAK